MTTGYRLVALNAKPASRSPAFGKDGIVDLKVGVVYGTGQPIDLETGEIGLHSTPTVVKDVVIVGSSFKEGMTVITHNNTKGLVRAFDVRTGKLLWTFNTIPRPGEFGNDTWENDSWAINGNTGVWTQITVDEEARARLSAGRIADLRLLRRPSPGQQSVRRQPRVRRSEDRRAQVALPDRASSDLGLRPVVGADAGRHHGRTAGAIKAVALPSKEAFLYVFDRVTGQPVWPIEERPVPQTRRAGREVPRRRSRSRPSRRPTRGRRSRVDDLIDFTPELRAQALENLKRYKNGPDVQPAGRRARSAARSAR